MAFMSMDRGQQFSQDVLPGMERSDSRVHNVARPLPRVAEDMQLSMVMPKHALEKAVEENKFKNAFEAPGAGVGAGRSSYLEGRTEVENRLFGIPKGEDGDVRPVYGMLREKNAIERWGEDDKPAVPHYLGSNRSYGDTLVDIKPPREDQYVTTTSGDSIDDYSDYLEARDLNRGDFPGAGPSSDYTEVQWHDRPVPKQDIEAVHIMSPTRWKERIPTEAIGSQQHKDIVHGWRGEAQQVGRDLRVSGLRAPVHYWENQIRHQPSMFSAEHFSNPNYDESWTKGQRTEDWSRRQV